MSDPAEKPELPEFESLADTDEKSLVERIDALADLMADLAEKDETPVGTKMNIFDRLVDWSKIKGKIKPDTRGSRLKEFQNELKSGKGTRASGSKPALGGEIRKIIRALPTPTRPRIDGGSAAGAEREGERDPGALRSAGPDLSGDGEGDGDGAGDSVVV